MKFQNRLDNLTVQRLDDEIDPDTYQRIKQKTKAEIQEVTEALDDAQVERARPPEKLIPSLIRDWNTMETHVKRDLLSRILGTVIVGEGHGKNREITIRGLWESPPTVER